MKISDIGGEFALIRRLAQIGPGAGKEVLQGIGDDAAVIQVAPEPAPYLLVTTDTLVDRYHFRRDWSGPEQIGLKAAECNVSDIAAMGGKPQWMFISLVLSSDMEVEWAEGVYRGLAQSCRQHGISLIGGDTTQGVAAAIGITLIGWAAPSHLCLRSHARPGDLLVVTGSLGASAAGLALLEKGLQPAAYLLQKHLTPRCRLDASFLIAPWAHAMIDISDGLGGEVRHICEQSGVGAEIDADAIPLHACVLAAGAELNKDPLQWALTGGEDFELLFSIAPEQWEELEQTELTLYPVGRVVASADHIVLIDRNGRSTPLPSGYDHFQ